MKTLLIFTVLFCSCSVLLKRKITSDRIICLYPNDTPIKREKAIISLNFDTVPKFYLISSVKNGNLLEIGYYDTTFLLDTFLDCTNFITSMKYVIYLEKYKNNRLVYTKEISDTIKEANYYGIVNKMGYKSIRYKSINLDSTAYYDYFGNFKGYIKEIKVQDFIRSGE